jgi:hypothetical protein
MGQSAILTGSVKRDHVGTATMEVSHPIGAARARIHLPETLGPRFVLFADAEEEFDWHGEFNRCAISTKTIADLVPATERFNAAGLKPVYLCDYPVVDNAESAAIMRHMVETGACDVGTQLHPWVNPPFDEAVNVRNSYTGNLPLALQQAKLDVLTARIEENIGVRPTVYRAGRYGLGTQTMAMLAAAGYRMDVSVRAGFDYRNQSGPNYFRLPVWPWRTAEGVIELPLTAGWTGALRKAHWLHRKGIRGVLARLRLMERVPLTPEGVPVEAAVRAIEIMHEEGVEIFSLSFHTPSVAIGHTPYVRNQADLDRFWAWWDGVFDCFARLGILPIDYATLVDALERR